MPELRPAGYTILGWSVGDITGTVRRLADAGVAVQRYEGLDQDDDGIWDSPGARVAWFADPRRQRPVAHPVARLLAHVERSRDGAVAHQGAPKRIHGLEVRTTVGREGQRSAGQVDDLDPEHASELADGGEAIAGL